MSLANICSEKKYVENLPRQKTHRLPTLRNHRLVAAEAHSNQLVKYLMLDIEQQT